MLSAVGKIGEQRMLATWCCMAFAKPQKLFNKTEDFVSHEFMEMTLKLVRGYKDGL